MAEKRKGSQLSEASLLFEKNLNFSYWWLVKALTLVVVFCDVRASNFSVMLPEKGRVTQTYYSS